MNERRPDTAVQSKAQTGETVFPDVLSPFKNKYHKRTPRKNTQPIAANRSRAIF